MCVPDFLKHSFWRSGFFLHFLSFSVTVKLFIELPSPYYRTFWVFFCSSACTRYRCCNCQIRGQGDASPQEKGSEQYGETNNAHAVSDIVQQQRVRRGKFQRIDDDAPGDPEKGRAHEETKAGLLREED